MCVTASLTHVPAPPHSVNLPSPIPPLSCETPAVAWRGCMCCYRLCSPDVCAGWRYWPSYSTQRGAVCACVANYSVRTPTPSPPQPSATFAERSATFATTFRSVRRKRLAAFAKCSATFAQRSSVNTRRRCRSPSFASPRKLTPASLTIQKQEKNNNNQRTPTNIPSYTVSRA